MKAPYQVLQDLVVQMEQAGMPVQVDYLLQVAHQDLQVKQVHQEMQVNRV